MTSSDTGWDNQSRTTYTVEVFQVHATALLTALSSMGDQVSLNPAFEEQRYTSYTASVARSVDACG